MIDTDSHITKAILKIGCKLDSFNDPFLYSGKNGAVLYNAYLFFYYKDVVHYNKTISLLEECFSEFNLQASDTHNLNTLAGFGWVIQHLVNLKIFSLDDHNELLLDSIDGLITKSIEADGLNNNYDLVFGLIGKGIYFIERIIGGKNLQKQMRTVTDAILKNSLSDKHGIYWVDKNNPNSFHGLSEKSINLGLAHGLPGIISFLCMVSRFGEWDERDSMVLEKSVTYLLRQETQERLSSFPNTTALDHTSRLGWCYGDLGVALSLFRASEVLGSDQIKKAAIRIALNSSKRNIDSSDVHHCKEFDVYDTSFCHGLAGVTHFYSKFYKITGNQVFDDAFKYWLSKLLEQIEKQQHILSTCDTVDLIKLIENDPNFSWIDDNTIIGGASGAGLVLMEIINEAQSGWDRIFLTSI